MRLVIRNRFNGVYDSSAVRYPITQQNRSLRTKHSHSKDVEEVTQLRKPINGYATISTFLLCLRTSHCLYAHYSTGCITTFVDSVN